VGLWIQLDTALVVAGEEISELQGMKHGNRWFDRNRLKLAFYLIIVNLVIKSTTVWYLISDMVDLIDKKISPQLVGRE
jgi:hypothetical protein